MPEVDEDIYLTPAGKLKAWRLLSLIDSFRKQHGTPTLDDIDLLGRVASGKADLHDACAALEHGCGAQHLKDIFT